MKKITLLILLLSAAYGAFSQYRLTGKVTDSEMQPLPGASVVISNTYFGVSTGPDGKF